MKFNRTLDVFYLAQISAAIWRCSDQARGEFPDKDDFDAFYAQHHELLNQDAWRQYYSPAFLAQPTSARFYRLPNLQDLPDSSGELGKPRQKGVGHFTKLPRWASGVTSTHWRQPSLSAATMTKIALSTLQQSILQLQKDCPAAQIQPYSKTQACFWLKYMKMDSPPDPSLGYQRNAPYDFGVTVALGHCDIWAWEAHYSPELWASSANEPLPLEPDLDGTRESEVYGCAWPEAAGVIVDARESGWEPEVGSEEEIVFLAAVALKETEGLIVGIDLLLFNAGWQLSYIYIPCDMARATRQRLCCLNMSWVMTQSKSTLIDMSSKLDYAIRSHMLLGVMRAAFMADRDEQVENLKNWMVKAGRFDDGTAAEQWIREALMVMEPYTDQLHGQMLKMIGPDYSRTSWRRTDSFFARWKLSPFLKEFDFKLKPRQTS